MSNVIFLDVDGVMAPTKMVFHPSHVKGSVINIFDPVAVGMINQLPMDVGPCSIVLTSVWRKQGFDRCQAMFSMNKVTVPFHEQWCTDPTMSNRTRSITEWIDQYGASGYRYLVVDDEALDCTIGHLFLRTCTDNGFMFSDYEEMRLILETQ